MQCFAYDYCYDWLKPASSSQDSAKGGAIGFGDKTADEEEILDDNWGIVPLKNKMIDLGAGAGGGGTRR